MAIKKGYRQLVDEANAEIRTVSPEEAREMATAGDAVMIDIRDVRELHRMGQIAGAEHCPRGMLEFWIDPDSPYHKPLFAEDKAFIFFCAAGWRSALATKTAQDMGLEQVMHVDGGFAGWKEAGMPIIEPEPKK